MNIEDAKNIVKIFENSRYGHYVYDIEDYHKAQKLLKELQG